VARDPKEGPDTGGGGLGDEGDRVGRPEGADDEARAARGRPSGDGAPAEEQRTRTPTSAQVGRIAVLLLAALFGVFALVNSHPVGFSWILGETRVQQDAAGDVTGGGVPLIVLLLVSFILGATLGGWWTWQAGRTRRRGRDDARQE
jgi:uncharacterized integral membrane protein